MTPTISALRSSEGEDGSTDRGAMVGLNRATLAVSGTAVARWRWLASIVSGFAGHRFTEQRSRYAADGCLHLVSGRTRFRASSNKGLRFIDRGGV